MNHAPVAADDSVNVPQDSVLTVPAKGVLANDLDSDGDLLTARVKSQPVHGTLQQEPDGGFTYTPNPGYTGPDSFIVTGTDGHSHSVPVTITLNVTDTTPLPTKPIPVLSQWAVIVLSLLMLMVAGRVRYRVK